MYQSEYAVFQQSMVDLCEAFNRPLKDDLVRVFWEALKEFSLQQIRARVRLHIANGKKFPNPAELKPAPDQNAQPSGPSALDVLDEYLQRSRLTFKQGRELTYIGRPGQITGVVVPPDGDTPGFKIMAADLGFGGAA